MAGSMGHQNEQDNTWPIEATGWTQVKDVLHWTAEEMDRRTLCIVNRSLRQAISVKLATVQQLKMCGHGQAPIDKYWRSRADLHSAHKPMRGMIVEL